MKFKLLTKVLATVLVGATLLSSCAPKTTPAPTEAASTESTTSEAAAPSETALSQTTPTVVKVGVVGERNAQWDAVNKILEKDNIKVELVKLSDYSLPNLALNDGELDLNAFQHIAFLNNEIDTKKYDLTPIAETFISPLGIYSKKITDVNSLPEKAKVAIPSDSVNGGRALKLLEAAGVIKVDPSKGYIPEIADITENPKNVEIIPTDASQIAALLPDFDAACINGDFARTAGLFPTKDSIFLETVQKGSDNPYINILVARTVEKDNPVFQKIIEAYHTDEVKKVMNDEYEGGIVPVW